jgi:SAM-dependent methyltransferase
MGSRGSVSFDRIADRYDETRGGLERGGNVAGAIAPHLAPGLVVEIGVGTGAVALPLVQRGHPVVGFDLSLPMLRRAHDRLGSRVTQADAHQLPVPGAAAPNVVMVWVLHLVADLPAVLAEAARILAPGGRTAVVPAGGQWDDDDIGAIVRAMHEALQDVRPHRDAPPDVVAAAHDLGLSLIAEIDTRSEVWHHSPEDQARAIESRTWSSLWDLPDDRWAAVVEPAIAALRALPDPTRPRARRTHYRALVFDRP